jgi:hypothetical protein
MTCEIITAIKYTWEARNKLYVEKNIQPKKKAQVLTNLNAFFTAPA